MKKYKTKEQVKEVVTYGDIWDGDYANIEGIVKIIEDIRQQDIETIVEIIKELQRQTIEETGAYKYDFCYEEIIEKLKNLK